MCTSVRRLLIAAVTPSKSKASTEPLVEEQEALAGGQHVPATRDRGDSADVPVQRHRPHLVGAAVRRQRGPVKATAEDVDPQQLLALLMPARALAEQPRLE